MYAIQMARILGLNVVATCSPKNMNAVRNCGASVVFDYHDVDVESQIAGLAPPPAYALDTIGSNTTLEITARLIEQNRGTLCSVKPSAQNYDNLPASVTVTSVFVFTAFLKRHVYRKTYTWPVSSGYLFCLICTDLRKLNYQGQLLMRKK
jgi:NADPH:quinone reductase-like Zn-dependent oxidoreductase